MTAHPLMTPLERRATPPNAARTAAADTRVTAPLSTTNSRPARMALTKAEAAYALGISVDFLERHVIHELRIVRRGRRRLIPITELQRWLDSTAARTLP